MYNDELEAIDVAVENLFLDPNNPRFSVERNGSVIPDKKICDPSHQKRTQQNIENYSIDDLRDSILRNGFLKMDRIVVRPIEECADMYVVVEGNRRLASLKKLRQQIEDAEIVEEGITDEYLEKLKTATDVIEVLLYKGQQEDIAWMLQGIRHISGIKEWQPAQKAQLVAKLVDKGFSYNQVGQQFGLSARDVGQSYRAYKALGQMRRDDEYGGKARNDYFSIFKEACSNTNIREWLGWDKDSLEFKNTDRLKQFYSWITPDNDNEGKRRIHDPKHVRHLDRLIAKKHDDLISQIDQYETTIETAWGLASKEPGDYNWMTEIDKAVKSVKGLPNYLFIETSDSVKEEQNSLKEALSNLKALVEKTIERLEDQSSLA